MIWPTDKQMSPQTAQKLIDALEIYKDRFSHIELADSALTAAWIEGNKQAHYPPLNTDAPRAPYDGMWKPENAKEMMMDAANAREYKLIRQVVDLAQTVDKLVKRVEMLESMQMGLKPDWKQAAEFCKPARDPRYKIVSNAGLDPND